MRHKISDSSIQTNTKNLKDCPKVSTGESRRKCVPTPMHRFMGGTRKLITKTYIKWINRIPHCHHGLRPDSGLQSWWPPSPPSMSFHRQEPSAHPLCTPTSLL